MFLADILETRKYKTLNNENLMIFMTLDIKTQIYRTIYCITDYEDVIAASDDVEFVEFKTKQFIQDRGLRLQEVM